MSVTTLDSVVHVSLEVMDQDVGGESVLLHLGVGRYFGLNSTGTHIWRLLRNGWTLDDILHDLARVYGAGAGSMETDLLDLVDSLRDAGIVSVSKPGE